MLALLAIPCFAAEITPQALERSAREGSMELAAPRETVLAVMADPAELARVTRTGKLLSSAADGVCTQDSIWMAAGADSVEYTVRTCPTADGLHASLVASEDLERFEADWRLVPVAGGTHVTFSLDLKAKDAWFASRVATDLAVSDSLHALRRHFALTAPIDPTAPELVASN